MKRTKKFEMLALMLVALLFVNALFGATAEASLVDAGLGGFTDDSMDIALDSQSPAGLMEIMPFSTDVCEIEGGDTYASFAEAFAAAVEGDTITMLSGGTETIAFQLRVDKNIAIDMNGFSYVIECDQNINVFVLVKDKALTIYGLGMLTVRLVMTPDPMASPGVALKVDGSGGQVNLVDGGSLRVEASGNVIGGVQATGESIATVTAVAVAAEIADAIGARADESDINVNGAITVSGYGSIGIFSRDGGRVNILGNVAASGTDSIGTVASNGQITIDGTLSGES